MSSPLPGVSVVIPCYNLGEFLLEAVDSVRGQTHSHVELIIVDDGSTDKKTLQVIESLQGDSNILIIRQKNQGLSQTRNSGIKVAKNEYIVCLDADDKLEPEYVERCLNIFTDANLDDNLAIVSTWLKEFGLREEEWRPTEFNVPELLITNRLHAASMFKKSVWQEVGGYKKEMIGGYEDWEFWLSIIEKGYRWSVVPQPLFNYRIRENSMLSESDKKHNILFERIYRIHKTLFQKYQKEYALAMNRELKSVRNNLADQITFISQLNKNLDILTNQLATERKNAVKQNTKMVETIHELAELKGSRLISKAIKARHTIGQTRGYATRVANNAIKVPRRAVHHVRVVTAPLIPSKARKIAKNKYRQARDLMRPKVKLTIVPTAKWSSKKPLVSVVIPYYNLPHTIDDSLNSLRGQTLKRFEVIIVNDGSPDPESQRKFRQLDTSGLKVTLIDQKNQGVAAARNRGLREADGKYLMCLDADDMLEPTYLEKAIIYLETHPEHDLFNCYMTMFGVEEREESKLEYDPLALLENNMIITAAVYRRDAWEQSGGYKSDIGYEDWEYWLSLAEKGYWGKTVPEALFRYRTAVQSRYIDDRMAHWDNMKRLKELHLRYKEKLRKLIHQRAYTKKITDRPTAYINLSDDSAYPKPMNDHPNVLLALPWMTFGGAETLIYNFCRELRKGYNISFVTGLASKHEWEWKFKEITPNIYHLSNLFESSEEYIDFISNYIRSRDIKILHIIHTSFMFDLLPELKKRHPDLKVIATMFNDRAEHFQLSVDRQRYITTFTTDNELVAKHYRELINSSRHKDIVRIPNGINCYDDYNPELFEREKQRERIGLGSDDIGVFFIGRLSEEKNPDVFLEVARRVIATNNKKVKFYVIGDGAMRPKVEKLINGINSDQVVDLGYQAHVAPYLSAADIFVLPSSIEGFPLSILEAMAMRAAVIASRVGAVPDVIEDGVSGIIVSPGSADEIEAAIKELCNNAELLHTIKANSRKAVEDVYSNTLLGNNYRHMYQSTLRHH